MMKKIKNKAFFLYFIVLLLLWKSNDVKPWCSGFVAFKIFFPLDNLFFANNVFMQKMYIILY